MINQKLVTMMDEQINKEFFSAYLYLAIADYFEESSLKGYSNYFQVQAQEERDHALILRNYLHENGHKVTMGTLADPGVHFDNFGEALQAVLEHEMYITASINDLYNEAFDTRDFRTMQFLDWFVKEQIEEEDNANSMIDAYELFGSDPKGLYQLDREYMARMYTVPSPLATA